MEGDAGLGNSQYHPPPAAPALERTREYGTPEQVPYLHSLPQGSCKMFCFLQGSSVTHPMTYSCQRNERQCYSNCHSVCFI